MNDILQSLERGFEKYYNTLSKLGYVSIDNVYKLVIVTWINDVLAGRYDMMVSEEQYRILENIYSCFEGSCLIPYGSYCDTVTVNRGLNRDYIRTTEIDTTDYGSTERILELDDNLRTL